MEQSKIDMFLAFNSKFFAPEKLQLIRSQLERMDDSKFLLIQSLEYRDPTLMLIISLFAGGFGVDRFMLGQTGLGVLKLLTCGGFGVWVLVDWFLIYSLTREQNFTKAMHHLH